MIQPKLISVKLILVFLLCIATNCFYAQVKSKDVKTVNGKKYYIHKVEKGQSLYAISKVYETDVNTILTENHDAIDGLKNGQELKIPFDRLPAKQTTLAIDTNKYKYHKIAKGETVYAITKKYEIDEKKLLNYNSTISTGLKEGDYLIVGEKKKEISQSPTTSSTTKGVTYTVLKGETLYSISKKLNTTQDELLSLNPDAKNGIKEGQVLNYSKTLLTLNANYPYKNNVITSAQTPITKVVKDTVTIISKPKKSAYNIGLFLPFKLAQSESISIDDLARTKSSFPQTQSLAIDFYIGFKKMVDSLKSKDFDITLNLYDIDEKDSAKIEQICKTTEFKQLDAIFGPLYFSVFRIASKHAKALNIPSVSPLTQQNKILFNNPFVSKVNLSQFTIIESLADYCSDSLMGSANIILVNSTLKDQAYVKSFKQKYNGNLVTHGKTLKDSIIEVKGIGGVKSAIVAGKKNIVVLLTNNQVYLQDFITQLYVFSDKKDIVLMGFNNVASIDNLDQGYLNGLQFHYAAANDINYNDSIIKTLVKQYQDIYVADPSEYYFEGYDIASYYLTHLKNDGPAFFLNLDKYKADGLSLGFKFYRPDLETGFENRAVYIYKYSDFKVYKLGWK